MSATSPTAQLVDQDHLPPSWTVAQVDEVGRVQMGRQRSPEFQSGRFTKPYLRAANILDGRIDTTDVLSMDFDPSDFQSFKLRDRDVLIVEGGTVGRSAVYRGTIPDVCFQNTVIRFQVNERLTCPEFADYLFRHYFYRGGFKDVARQTTIAHLGLTRFAKMPFILPPLPEQRRIVEAIETNFARLVVAVERLTQAMQTLGRLRESVLHDAFDNGWPEATVGEVTDAKISQEGPCPLGSFSYVDISSVDNLTKRITAPKSLLAFEAPSRARQNLKAGDVLISLTRPNLNAVAIVPRSLHGAVGSTGFCVLRSREIDPRWLYYLVQTPEFIRTMSNKVLGVLYPAIRPRDIHSYPLPVPPLTEQRGIVEEVERNLSVIDEIASEGNAWLSRSVQLRQSILKAAFEGRLVPQDPFDEPASVLLEHIKRERSSPKHVPAARRSKSVAPGAAS